MRNKDFHNLYPWSLITRGRQDGFDRPGVTGPRRKHNISSRKSHGKGTIPRVIVAVTILQLNYRNV